MNYLRKLSKKLKYKQKKQKVNFIKDFAVLSVLGITIGRVAAMLLAKSSLDKKRNNATRNSKDIDEVSKEDSNEEINIKRDEIKQTLEEYGEEVVGDVGVAMEKALEDLEDDKQNENEVAK